MRVYEELKINGVDCQVCEGVVYGVYRESEHGREVGGYYIGGKNILPCSVAEFEKKTYYRYTPQISKLEKDFYSFIRHILDELETVEDYSDAELDEKVKKVYDICISRGCDRRVLRKKFVEFGKF